MQFPKRANRELNAANSELNRTDHGNKSRLLELPIVNFQELAPEKLPDGRWSSALDVCGDGGER
jgi:hypothetical protein